MATHIVRIDASQGLSDSDVYLIDASRIPVIFSLPDPRGTQGRKIILKKIDATGNAVRVVTLQNGQVDGVREYTLTVQHESIHLESDGRGYFITKGYRPNTGGGGGSGEANTASNVGAGAGVFQTKVGVDLRFKSLVPGSGVSITPSSDELLISAMGAGSAQTHSHQRLELDGPAAVTVILPSAPDTGTDAVWFAGGKQHRVAGAPGIGEYRLVGTTVTLWAAPIAGEHIDITWETSVGSTHDHMRDEYVGAGPAAVLLSAMPLAGSEEPSLNGVKLKRVGSSPGLNEYTLSGTTLVLWTVRLAGDWLDVPYRV